MGDSQSLAWEWTILVGNHIYVPHVLQLLWHRCGNHMYTYIDHCGIYSHYPGTNYEDHDP